MKKFLIYSLLLLMCSSLLAKQGDVSLPPLVQASKEQQKSISQLVAALKEVRKAILPPGEKNEGKKEQKKNPFKDKQEYKNKPPENQLQKLAKQQKEIIKELKAQSKKEGQKNQEESPKPDSQSCTKPCSQSGGTGEAGEAGEAGEQSPTDLERKQQKISNGLKSLAKNEDLVPSVSEALKDAVDASEKAVEAMQEVANTEAQVSSEKTLSKIYQALVNLRDNAKSEIDKALTQAAQKLAEAERERKCGRGKKAAEKGKEAQEILGKAAQQQKRSGSQSAEKKLTKLVNKMQDGKLTKALAEKPKDQATADQLAAMREAIAQARQGDKTDREELEEAAKKLKSLQQEMKYMAKRPEELKEEQLSEMLSQYSGNAQRIGRALSRMTVAGHTFRGPVESEVREIGHLVFTWDHNADQEVVIKQLIELTDRILVKARQTLDPLEKEIIVRTLAKEEVPEKYQDDVATYFKRLSEPDKK